MCFGGARPRPASSALASSAVLFDGGHMLQVELVQKVSVRHTSSDVKPSSSSVMTTGPYLSGCGQNGVGVCADKLTVSNGEEDRFDRPTPATQLVHRIFAIGVQWGWQKRAEVVQCLTETPEKE